MREAGYEPIVCSTIAQLAIVVGQNSEANVTSGPMHDAESIPKLYGNPGMLGFLVHVQYQAESLGTRLCVYRITPTSEDSN